MGIPSPIFWGVLAAWIPVPPSVMVGILISAMIYAIINHLWSIRVWMVEEENAEPLY